jgi:hypothetical protein
MPKVVTTASQIECAHGGTVKVTASQSKLKVGGNPVLVETDMLTATVSGCKTPVTPPPPGPTQKPCLKVLSMNAGAATKLAVDGIPVVLDTATGDTDGISVPPTPLWSVKDAKETQMEAS